MWAVQIHTDIQGVGFALHWRNQKAATEVRDMARIAVGQWDAAVEGCYRRHTIIDEFGTEADIDLNSVVAVQLINLDVYNKLMETKSVDQQLVQHRANREVARVMNLVAAPLGRQ
jgi:hypothetical protein